jgi:oligoribonuclease
MTERRHGFLWLDLETTGLDPANGMILEWAAVLAADDADGDMVPVESYTGVIHVPRSIAWGMCDEYVRKMHTVNGLFDACDQADPSNTLAEAEAFLVQLVGGETARGVVLAGSTIAFDQAWLRVHMPTLTRCLHYRTFDVSTLKMAERSWFDATFYTTQDRDPAHRALPDVLKSLEAAAAWRKAVTERTP